MPSEADIGHGVRFQRNDSGSPPTWEDLGELLDSGGPSMARDAIEVTHSQSPDRFREFIPGMIDGGEATLQIAYIPGSTAFASLYADILSKEVKEYRILFPDEASTAWRFQGFITAISPTQPLTESKVADVTIKITGKPNLGPTP